jgi:hypothetical protein
VQGLRPCLLPLGSVISQQDFNARVAATGTLHKSVVDITPSKDKDKDKKKKRKQGGDEEPPPSTGKQKKEKKSKKQKE